MQAANLFGPLKGHCPYKALIGLTQASGLAGGFDSQRRPHRQKQKNAAHLGGVLDKQYNESALGELGSAAGGLQTVLLKAANRKALQRNGLGTLKKN